MKKKIMALCDSEKDYLDSMTNFLKEREGFPYELHTYTRPEKLVEFGKKERIEVLLVSESDFTYEVESLDTGNTLLLNESGNVCGEKLRNIDKYQKAEAVWKEILECYADAISGEGKRLKSEERAKIIGLYSPVRRCLQTSFALTLGQALSEQKKVLYISFEHYAGWNQLLDSNVRGDLAALLYFVSEPEEKFLSRMHSMTLKIGRLCYIPPAYAGQNLIYAKAGDWQALIEKIAELGGYDYLILDLSESIQGTFELLRMCDRIYTIIREDEQARSKLAQYEELLRSYEYEDVLEKTKKQLLPQFTRLPQRIEQYTGGELARYIRQLIKDDLGAA
ncbi:MAG: hypothetical protein J1E83_07515 [Lachnospiraceae bacterium]|nr:hypothetical protein [Lachnospiraceae bacterium]